jgi:hypothetical protein
MNYKGLNKFIWIYKFISELWLEFKDWNQTYPNPKLEPKSNEFELISYLKWISNWIIQWKIENGTIHFGLKAARCHSGKAVRGLDAGPRHGLLQAQVTGACLARPGAQSLWPVRKAWHGRHRLNGGENLTNLKGNWTRNFGLCAATLGPTQDGREGVAHQRGGGKPTASRKKLACGGQRGSVTESFSCRGTMGMWETCLTTLQETRGETGSSHWRTATAVAWSIVEAGGRKPELENGDGGWVIHRGGRRKEAWAGKRRYSTHEQSKNGGRSQWLTVGEWRRRLVLSVGEKRGLVASRALL